MDEEDELEQAELAATSAGSSGDAAAYPSDKLYLNSLELELIARHIVEMMRSELRIDAHRLYRLN